MKFSFPVLLFASLSTASSLFSSDVSAAAHTRRQVRRPVKYSGSAGFAPPPIPAGAPPGFKTSMGKASEMHDKTKMKKLPSNMIDADDPNAPLKPLTKRDVLRVSRGIQAPLAANDFYECATTGKPPTTADCDVVIDNVYAAETALSIAAGSCILFQYQTCWGFFCSLCEELSTTTDFIGNQLSTAETLCVAGGEPGTIVGEDSPQWEAGLLLSGSELPNYDVC
ncbi:hypothetical protein GGR57DRAFT_511406 [Xylariaceae sp. FL1272]|nr:hypothetical protein GGR57DRAFT_511406 [Xylariaceae sp. FL1272]